MYLQFFGFREMPFNITPNPTFLYNSPTHEEALQHLRYGIREKKGFMVLTGEVGCGKTTLCRLLLDEMDPASHETVLILNTRISETQLIRLILQEMGEDRKTRSRADLLAVLNEVLLQRIAAGKQILLFIDEAQNLSFEVLEQIRLLSNFEAEDQKLMQIILIGQPELDAKLREERLRQLRQRVLVHYKLRPLNVDETAQYLDYRLRRAGGVGLDVFSPAGTRLLHRRSRGIPRLINNLADKSLLAAFVRNSQQVTWWDVRRAYREMKELF